MRRALSATVILIASAVALTACGSDDGDSDVATFEREGYPFTFEYPGDLQASDDLDISTDLGAGADDSFALGLDSDNALILQRFTLNLDVTEENLPEAQREFDRLLSSVDPDAEGEPGELAGYPSITYDAISLSDPPEGESRLTAFFSGDQEFLINCQSTPEERESIDAACDDALSTIQPTG
jgi:hypothetical protein